MNTEVQFPLEAATLREAMDQFVGEFVRLPSGARSALTDLISTLVQRLCDTHNQQVDFEFYQKARGDDTSMATLVQPVQLAKVAELFYGHIQLRPIIGCSLALRGSSFVLTVTRHSIMLGGVTVWKLPVSQEV